MLALFINANTGKMLYQVNVFGVMGAAENAGRDGEAAGVELNLVLKLIHGTFPGTNVDNSIGV